MSTIRCPQCDSELKRCLILQNYSMVICPNIQCEFPFNEHKTLDGIVYTEDKEILSFAKQRLENGEKKAQQ
ncbi:LAMI_0B00584g1_1 [Lachancea mirantina]|uniref:LAMI_0B00584g1_1 n=1 Tax=Lachancea mirantina TaxID=1230905 RepID=A0A1G4IT64_9SACH|nr:LAMI_0B00584g1_1 [Lachancea mirantina]